MLQSIESTPSPPEKAIINRQINRETSYDILELFNKVNGVDWRPTAPGALNLDKTDTLLENVGGKSQMMVSEKENFLTTSPSFASALNTRLTLLALNLKEYMKM